MIRVLVVDDSAVVRELLTYILNSDPGVEVIGTAGTGEEAIEIVGRVRPDVITMDLHLPGLDGFDTTRKIMEIAPTPIVIVSGSFSAREVECTFRALEAGALMIIARPPGLGYPGHREAVSELVRSVKAMAEVKVVRRWPREQFRRGPAPAPQPAARTGGRPIDVVAIGASTGGPVILQTLLQGLPESFQVPLLIVQHMAPGFIQGFAEWLSSTCGRPLLVATQGTRLAKGHGYIAPDGHHMEVDRTGRISLTLPGAENGLCPSVAHLFRSVADAYGSRAAAVLLSGMGRDGAEELKRLRDCGAVTFAQDAASSVIHGMPGEAIRLDAADYVMEPQRIAEHLRTLCG